MAVTNKPRIEAYIGASGSGKGVSINRRLDDLKPARLIIWDPRNEYGTRAPAVTNMAEAVSVIRGARGGPFRVRYVPGPSMPLERAFDVMCKAAFAAGNLVFLAEELSDVTTAARAPASWRQVITQGRHQGLHVIGAAQRPALIDKTFLGNCTYIRCFTLRYREDRRAMAAALDVDEDQVTALKTSETPWGVLINYIERDFREDRLNVDCIKLKAKR